MGLPVVLAAVGVTLMRTRTRSDGPAPPHSRNAAADIGDARPLAPRGRRTRGWGGKVPSCRHGGFPGFRSVGGRVHHLGGGTLAGAAGRLRVTGVDRDAIHAVPGSILDQIGIPDQRTVTNVHVRHAGTNVMNTLVALLLDITGAKYRAILLHHFLHVEPQLRRRRAARGMQEIIKAAERQVGGILRQFGLLVAG